MTNASSIDECLRAAKLYNADFEQVKDLLKNQLSDTDTLVDKLNMMEDILDRLVDDAYIKKDSAKYKIINTCIDNASSIISGTDNSIEKVYSFHENYENVLKFAVKIKADKSKANA